MQDQFVVTKDEIINLQTGSKIIFKGEGWAGKK